jgi:predicted small lipoprotein YifL
MNLRLIRLAVFAAALLAVPALLSACGKKGDLVRPSAEPVAEDTAEDTEELF